MSRSERERAVDGKEWGEGDAVQHQIIFDGTAKREREGKMRVVWGGSQESFGGEASGKKGLHF